jgi:hypothetical protein
MANDSGVYLGPSKKSPEYAESLFKKATDEVRETGARNVFISFHNEDETQVNLLRAQAKTEGSDLIFRDYSVKEPFDEKWKTNCSERIAQTSATICMIGPDTANRDAVNWEIEESYRQGKKVVGVRIYRDQNHRIPKPLLDNQTPILDWNLKRIAEELYGEH